MESPEEATQNKDDSFYNTVESGSTLNIDHLYSPGQTTTLEDVGDLNISLKHHLRQLCNEFSQINLRSDSFTAHTLLSIAMKEYDKETKKRRKYCQTQQTQ